MPETIEKEREKEREGGKEGDNQRREQYTNHTFLSSSLISLLSYEMDMHMHM